MGMMMFARVGMVIALTAWLACAGSERSTDDDDGSSNGGGGSGVGGGAATAAGIYGSVVAGAESGDVLVVAEDASGKGIATTSNSDGSYAIVGLPDGSYEVRGYAAGLQLVAASATVSGSPVTGVDLELSNEPLGSVSGSVQIVNAPSSAATTVVLVVASTYQDGFVGGAIPRGLRAPSMGPPSITGAYDIQGVPQGDYVVLPAFENDGLVGDPDFCTAGSDAAMLTMPRPGISDTVLPLKVTGALGLVGPGAQGPEEVTSAPTLEWAADSSESYYTVVVYDEDNQLVWCRSNFAIDGHTCEGPDVPAVSGASTVTVSYDGPLTPGVQYQFHAMSYNAMDCPISTTESQRGVFFVAGP